MTGFQTFAVLVVILIILRRVFALPISIGGSIGLTLLVWVVMRAIEARGRD